MAFFVIVFFGAIILFMIKVCQYDSKENRLLQDLKSHGVKPKIVNVTGDKYAVNVYVENYGKLWRGGGSSSHAFELSFGKKYSSVETALDSWTDEYVTIRVYCKEEEFPYSTVVYEQRLNVFKEEIYWRRIQ